MMMMKMCNRKRVTLANVAVRQHQSATTDAGLVIDYLFNRVTLFSFRGFRMGESTKKEHLRLAPIPRCLWMLGIEQLTTRY